MATASEISVGVSHELAITATKVGFEPKDFATLAHSEDKMAGILGVLRGTHEVKPIDHVIDLGSPAKLPFDGAVLEVHRGEGVVKLERRGDDLYLDGKPLNLFLSRKQKNGGVIGGYDLRKELEKRGNNVSAKVLDHLVAHPELWPESWKKDAQGNTVYVFFWDDIFRYPASVDLCVRYASWDEGTVVSVRRWLGSNWHGSDPAASSAS
ncbi:MAG: hypothetical protein NUW02_00315 [Candidatus Campbellbacteria bacterium]|nr:hypothetical protein [Candidatus Campbellbacteria bacterium]